MHKNDKYPCPALCLPVRYDRRAAGYPIMRQQQMHYFVEIFQRSYGFIIGFNKK